MKGFRFRLARVLRVRRLEEQVARAHYLERQSEARQADQLAARGVEEARRMEVELVQRLSSGPLEPHGVIQAQTCIDQMGAVCARRRELARTSALQADQARAPWSEARIDVRALETLEGKKRDRLRTELERRANRELDETATRRARKNNGPPPESRRAARGKGEST